MCHKESIYKDIACVKVLIFFMIENIDRIIKSNVSFNGKRSLTNIVSHVGVL